MQNKSHSSVVVVVMANNNGSQTNAKISVKWEDSTLVYHSYFEYAEIWLFPWTCDDTKEKSCFLNEWTTFSCTIHFEMTKVQK